MMHDTHWRFLSHSLISAGVQEMENRSSDTFSKASDRAKNEYYVLKELFRPIMARSQVTLDIEDLYRPRYSLG